MSSHIDTTTRVYPADRTALLFVVLHHRYEPDDLKNASPTIGHLRDVVGLVGLLAARLISAVAVGIR